MNYFIILLVIILAVIYLTNFMSKENFVIGYESGYSSSYNPNDYGPVNYGTRKQDCGELTYTPEKCITDTVIPSNKIVCTESATPITNNEKSCANTNTVQRNPTLSLEYDFDLLSSFNDAQIDGGDKIPNDKTVSELETFDDLKTDIKSLASLENDLMSNY